MLRVEGLSLGLRAQTLHGLREVCNNCAIFPGSRVISGESSMSTTDAHAASEHAEVWRGELIPGDKNATRIGVCFKVIKTNVCKVSQVSSISKQR